jgi:hypothetical protein
MQNGTLRLRRLVESLRQPGRLMRLPLDAMLFCETIIVLGVRVVEGVFTRGFSISKIMVHG